MVRLGMSEPTSSPRMQFLWCFRLSIIHFRLSTYASYVMVNLSRLQSRPLSATWI